MANQVFNDVVFAGNVDRIKAAIGDERNAIDFEKLIPMPEDLSVIENGHAAEAVSAYLSAVNPENEAVIYEKYRINDYNALYDELSTSFVALKDDLKSVDFRNVLFGKRYANNVRKYGYITWYDWRIAMWGTNKAAFEAAWDGSTLTFSTVENCCEPIIQKIALMFPEAEIKYCWVSEEPGALYGEATMKGKKIKRKELPGYSKEAFEAFAKYFEVDLADYGYVYDITRGTYIIP